jgi:hypothetical protein
MVPNPKGHLGSSDRAQAIVTKSVILRASDEDVGRISN